jgi:hypothetical protein
MTGQADLMSLRNIEICQNTAILDMCGHLHSNKILLMGISKKLPRGEKADRQERAAFYACSFDVPGEDSCEANLMFEEMNLQRCQQWSIPGYMN